MRRHLLAGLLVCAVVPPSALAAPSPEADSQSERIERLETQVDILAAELSRARTRAGVPETPEDDRSHGLGPAASKIYRADSGLSVGGYGELRLQTQVGAENGTDQRDDILDALRAVFYVGWKFGDRALVNSEIEIEHASTEGEGAVSLEFLNIDYFVTDELGLRAGLLLVPMGFLNEVHEPPFYFGAERPEVERRIIPSTWRENGVGVFGRFAGRFEFRLYAVNGMSAAGFSVDGLRGGRQSGSKALANHWAFVARGDFDLTPALSLGASVYTGKSGQNQQIAHSIAGNPISRSVPDTLTTLYEVHAQYRADGLTLRGLFAQAFVQDAAKLNFAQNNAPLSSVAEQMYGGYAEIGYDVLPLLFEDAKMSLEPFFRYERIDTQHVMPRAALANRKFAQDILTLGIGFHPIDQIVVKFDYRHIRPQSDPDDVGDQIQASVGYVF